MKTKSSGVGAEAMFMKRAPKPELCHFYNGSAVLDAGRITTRNNHFFTKGKTKLLQIAALCYYRSSRFLSLFTKPLL